MNQSIATQMTMLALGHVKSAADSIAKGEYENKKAAKAAAEKEAAEKEAAEKGKTGIFGSKKK